MSEIKNKKKESILIIDDIPTNIQLLANYLSKEGYKVAACSDSTQAIKIIRKSEPDLILLDIMMNEISGYDICTAIKKDNNLKDIPVIFLTAKKFSDDIVKGFEAGAVDYITKPFNSVEVLARIKTHLELQQTRKVLLNKNMILEEQSKAKSTFLAKMSHEIRTPLNAIIGMTTKLRKQNFTSYQHKYLQVLDNTCNNLLYIVNDILDLSKIEAGEYRLESKTFHLLDTIEKVCEISAFLAHQKKIELVCNIDHNIIQYVKGDSVRLQQVIHNLINNAIKFTNNGEIELKVIQKETPEKNKVLLNFSISDTGIGIPKEYQQQIFKNYQHAKSEKGGAYSGAGLGLPICQKIINLMKGYLTVKSEENKGSVFSFTIPFLISEQTKEININKNILKNKKILIFDHNNTNRQVLGDYLEFLGAKVDYSKTNAGFKLLRQAEKKEQSYSIIFIDANFKDETKSFSDGFSVANHIINEKNEIKIVLIIDTQNMEKDISRIESMPFCDYLLKPIKRIELISLIDNKLNSSHDLNESEPVLSQSPKIGDINILLVEDHPNNQFVFISYMDETPAKIDIAENGEVAVNKIKENKYDIIFMDIEMSIMDGYESTKLIREWENKKNLKPTPIIALTAHVLKTESLQIEKKGFTNILHKPLKQEKLLEMIVKSI